MHIVFLNSMLKTADLTKNSIPTVNTLKDSMIYNFALAFSRLGHRATVVGALEYKPIQKEEYEIEILLFRSIFTNFLPVTIPFHPELITYLRKNRTEIDLIISSEAFSLNTLIAGSLCGKKLVIWHELAKHNCKYNYIPSYFWYNVVCRFFLTKFPTIGRSRRSINFIKKYMKRVYPEPISHGIYLDKFYYSKKKKTYFVVIASFIDRKNIPAILHSFANFRKDVPNGYQFKLYLIGDGEKRSFLEAMTENLKLKNAVIFLGEMEHSEIVPILNNATAMLIASFQENSMLTISESIACGTPVLTNTIPDNSDIIQEYSLGIVKDNWGSNEMQQIVEKNSFYIENCINYRKNLSYELLAQKMLEYIHEMYLSEHCK